MTSAATSPALTPAIVSTDELLELADWERKYSDATKKVTAAEKELKFRRQQLAEKVLGVNSSDELKKLSPVQVEKLAAKRLAAGNWKAERGAPKFAFVKKHQGAYPAWREEFIKARSETAAAEIAANTPVMYSYAVEVSTP